jgi:glc operon protein GlcG
MLRIPSVVRSVPVLAGITGLVTSSATAQVTTQQTLTLDGARRVVAAAEAAARGKAGTGVIAVVDAGGNLMALERLDGTFAAGAHISIGKARTAAQFRKPTKVFEDIIRNGRTPMVALDDFTPLQGGVPIVLNGEIVGAVGVSGAASAQEDEDLAVAGAAAIASPVMHGAVNYFRQDAVKSSFARGAVLLDGAGRNYMVHTSRRTEPGQAEIHLRDTDIMYVLEGSATLVTGGTAVDAKPTAADELRGTSIEGGDARQIARGDVITVPAGTPHWFKEVKGPLNYYTVKVR